jgi:diguanylate cyclase (GGDEF)-like protein
MRILVVEDDELIAESLVKCLTQLHYAVDVAIDGEAGWESVEACDYDLVVLDVMLPKLDGINLCRRLRSKGIKSPVLLLTAQDSINSKVTGLDAGADDYLAKPVDLQEFSARVRALLRRGNSTQQPLLEWENLQLDPSTCKVTYNNQPIRLTPKEYGLLELFLRNPNRVFNSGAIIDHLWSFEEPPTDDTVRAHLKGLRRKLQTGGVSSDPIETIYGIGYRLKEAPTKKTQNSKLKIQNSQSSLTQEEQAQQITRKVWERGQQKLGQRIAIIEQATTALLQDKLDEKLINQAYQNAHKLAGSLGMFGFDFGSHLASEIEQLLQVGVSLLPEQKLHLSELVLDLRQQLQRVITSPTANNFSDNLSLNESPLLLIVDTDKSLSRELVHLATARGIKCLPTANAAIARQGLLDNCPDAVILDLSNDTNEEALRLLLELNLYTPPIPVLVLANQDSLIDRVKINRFGGRAFLPKPVTSTQILEALTNILKRSTDTIKKVLLVDDDSEILVAVSHLLQPWGLKVYTLDNPHDLISVLEATSPDLLVLDVEMPEINGIELCQVIRNDPQNSSLPVIFITAHKDADTMRRVFAAGADDFVSKPILGPELVTRILNRLERSRLLKSMSEIDALTGVANRRKSIVEFEQFLHSNNKTSSDETSLDKTGSIKTNTEPLCFAVLKIQNLQQINQQHGHGVGDEVLYNFGRLLRRFFQNDIISRWGGAEFVVGMYNSTLKIGVQRLEEVLETLYEEKFSIPNNSDFRLNIYWGAAEYPQDGTDVEALYKVAISSKG